MVSKAMMVFGTVVAFGTLGAASASAGWLVNGASLTGPAALSTEALVDESPTFLVPALNLVFRCSAHFLDASAPQIFGTDQGFASALTFLSCNTIDPAQGCEPEKLNENIETRAVLVLAAKGKDESVNVTFRPETKTTLANIAFSEKNTCAFNGIEPVTGSVVVNAPTGQLSLLVQAFTGVGSMEGNNSLLIDGDKAFLDGSVLLTLASDLKWSFD